MTVTHGIALQMEWDQPHWAAFVVVFVSLANVGFRPEADTQRSVDLRAVRSSTQCLLIRVAKIAAGVLPDSVVQNATGIPT